MSNFIKKQNGITLIALVITIIVLLILAGVSISMLSGENGILNRAAEASEKTKETGEKEELQLAITSLGIDYYAKGTGKTFVEYIFENIDKLKEELGESNIDANKDAKTITYKGKIYQVTDDGEVKLVNEENSEGGEEFNWEAILADANANPDSYKHEETLTSEYIAIGTDGQPVNMDLWNPTKLEDGTFLLGIAADDYSQNNAYVGSYDGGVIEGMVPQYIYNTDTNTFKPVVKMRSTFCCSALKTAPEIPDTVTDITYLFTTCYELTEVPEIPSGVTNMYGTFYNCPSLTEAPVIPSSVTDMSRTFDTCENLTGTITINANPTYYAKCFEYTVQPITLTNSATEEKTATEETLNNLKGTANKGNVTVVPAK